MTQSFARFAILRSCKRAVLWSSTAHWCLQQTAGIASLRGLWKGLSAAVALDELCTRMVIIFEKGGECCRSSPAQFWLTGLERDIDEAIQGCSLDFRSYSGEERFCWRLLPAPLLMVFL